VTTRGRLSLALAGLVLLSACAGREGLQPPGSFDDPADAAKHYRSLVKKDPSDALAHYYLGEAYRRQKMSADAESHYRTAIELDPTLTHAYIGLGRLLEGEGRFVAAADLYRDMMEKNTLLMAALQKVSMVTDSLARAEQLVRDGYQMLERGRHSTARLLFRRAASMAPFYLDARAGLAEALAARARFSRSYAERTQLMEDALTEYDHVLQEEAFLVSARDGRSRVAELIEAEQERFSRAEQHVAAGDSPFGSVLNPELDLPTVSFQNKSAGDVAFELSFGGGTKQQFVAVGKANVREGPDTDSRVLGSLSRGTVVFPLGEERGFTTMTDGNLQGWVASSLLESDVHLALRLPAYSTREMVLAPGTATCRCSRVGRTIWEGETVFLPYVSYVWSCE
jgi:tetratricopeptide (TPR) repeat protein